MSVLEISIESLGSEIVDAYRISGMDRGLLGASAIDWCFKSNPKPFAVARVDGQIVGVSSYILSKMKLENKDMASQGFAVQAVDSFVMGDQRGKGIFTKLAKAYDNHAAETGIDLVWGFPNDNAAPAWFGKLSWTRHGQVPFLIKPLRAGYLLRKLGLNFDFPLGFSADHGIEAETRIGDWANVLWDRVSGKINCATIRDSDYLRHRLIDSPSSGNYRIVADSSLDNPSLVVTTEAEKHGGRIGYLMEALGGPRLDDILQSELGRMRTSGTEITLAWAFPWSPNYRALRKAGFFPLPERLRPIKVWFGTRPKTDRAQCANQNSNWYLSYLDSDTI